MYNASSTPLLELMRFQIIHHLNCYLVWKSVSMYLEIQEGDRYPLWLEKSAVDSKRFGEAIRRNVVVKSALDIWSPGEEAFTNLKLCDCWWGVWLQWVCSGSIRSLPHCQTRKTVEILSWHYKRASRISTSSQQCLIGSSGLMGHLSRHNNIC